MEKIADVIKYEGDNTTFIWKHPNEDFNSLTQLIVHESQEAIFMMNGQALDLFGPGRYTLETQNIPKIGRFLKRATGDETPFHCEVYFINKTEQMAIKWGTDSKVEFMEPTYQFPIKIGACGEMNLRAEDSRKLLLKVVGTENYLTQSKLTKIKTYLARSIRESKISIFEIDEHLQELSENLHKMLIEDFADYGVALERFFVTTIVKPDGDSAYEKFKSLHFRQYADIAEAKLRQQVDIIDKQTEAQKMVIESQALAQKRTQEGYTYQQERGFDVAHDIARNEAVGQFTNMGVGFGTMAGVGGAVGGMVGNMMNDTLNTTMQDPSQMIQCKNCENFIKKGTKFCPECGEKVIQTDIVICPKCGKKVPRGKFCPECGCKLTKNVCPKCGNEIEANTKFCPECGEKI